MELIPLETPDPRDVVPPGLPTWYCFSPSGVGRGGLVNLICTIVHLFPDSSVFLRGQGVGRDHMNVRPGKVIRLGKILKFLNEVCGVEGEGS